MRENVIYCIIRKIIGIGLELGELYICSDRDIYSYNIKIKYNVFGFFCFLV